MPASETIELDTLIIDTVASVVVVTDTDARIIRFNAAALKLTGHALEDVIGKNIWEVLCPPERWATSHARFQQLLKGAALEFDTIWLTRGGEERPMSFCCKGVAGPSGQIEYTIGTGLDMTRSIAAERALRDSEARFRTTFAEAAIGIALVDRNGRYFRVNRAFCELTGYDEEELLKRDLLSITHPDDRDKNRELFEQIIDGRIGNYVLEKRYVKSDGSTLWVQVSATMTNAPGQPPTIIGLFENISARKAAEEAAAKAYEQLQRSNDTLEQRVAERTADLRARTEELARSEASLRSQSQILRSVLDSMGDAVVVVDAGGKLVLVNPAAERIAGPRDIDRVTLEEIGEEPRFFRSNGTRYATSELPLSRSLRGETVDDEEMLVHRRLSPGSVWLNVNTRPLRDESGNMQGAVLVSHDVTERRKQQERLEEANASLQKSERESRDLAESHLRLAREVEHRVRNNLAGLLGLIAVMRERATDVATFADAIESRLAAMQHVHQLLAQAQWTPLSLESLIHGMLATLRHLAPHPATMQVGGTSIFVAPLRVMPLTLVLVEWFTNSCKYGPHSVPGGKVCVSWEQIAQDPARVRLRWTESGGPPINGETRPSLGTELVNGFVGRELGGHCELRYPKSGADHVIEVTIGEKN